MNNISSAIKAKQAEIEKLQADIEALRRAASIIGEKPATTVKRKRRKRSVAARKAASQRMKAYWAKKKKSKR